MNLFNIMGCTAAVHDYTYLKPRRSEPKPLSRKKRIKADRRLRRELKRNFGLAQLIADELDRCIKEHMLVSLVGLQPSPIFFPPDGVDRRTERVHGVLIEGGRAPVVLIND